VYQKARPVHFFGEPKQLVATARYFGLTLGRQLTWAVHTNQVGKKAAQRLGVLGLLLDRKSDLFIRNDMLLYR
jgi:hypothetical protein